MKILATVAARGGSKGIRNKNIKELNGKPLIGHTAAQVVTWGGYVKFIVSSDSPEIMKAAEQYGAESIFTRPEHLSNDTAGKVDNLQSGIERAERAISTGEARNRLDRLVILTQGFD